MKRLGWINLVLIALMAVGFVARAYQIGSISNQFHTTRQFYTAQMVRGDYYANADVPEWRRAVALANQPLGLEPPVIQTVALVGYKLVGSEQLWIPRTFSALMWVIGGFFLFLAARKIMRPEAALIAVAFYLFTPYGIAASRSFQANPTMIALSVITYFAILHYFERPSKKRLFWAILSAASANVVMVYTVFTIYLLFGWLSLQRYGIRRVFKEPDTWLFSFFALLPAGLYYIYGLFFSGTLASQTGALFNPNLWRSPDYWGDWIGRIGIVVGYLPVIFSIQALITARKPLQSAVIRSLWLGYFIYGFVINWPIMSHDYYSMPLIPIVALSLGSVVDFVTVRLKTPRLRPWAVGLTLVIVAYISIDGLSRYLPTTTISPQLAQQVEAAQEIGSLVEHSTETIYLSPNYGAYLKYYGEIAGYNWPTRWDFYAALVAGKPEKSVEQRFNDITSLYPTRYFIITDFEEYEVQTDLADYLESNFALLKQTPDYLIYDLTQALPSTS